MSYRLLIAEDEKWVRVALRKVIGKLNLPIHLVYEAANGIDALDWIKNNHVELLLTDIRMPVMDGLTLLQDINEQGYKIDVMMISGHADFQYAQQALRQGAIDYLLKPVEEEALGSSLRSWIEKKELCLQECPPEVEYEELSPIEQIVQYIENNRAYEMSSCEAAEHVHLNPSYFSKLFRQTKGKTFTDYVTEMRMHEATRLLEKTSLRMSEIAARLGYLDSAYFTNSFKKTTGITPSNYRKKVMKE